MTESVHEGEGAARAAALSPVDAPSIPPDSVPRVCVVRAGNGITTTTTAPGQPPVTERIEADGPARPVRDGDCRGTERTEWSKNGKRLFARSEVKCTNQAARTLTGMALITTSGHWLDVRSFGVDGHDATRVSRYERVAGVSGRGTPLTIDEIKEAAMHVSPAVLEAVVAETRPRLAIDRKALIDLADARVPATVIDVMVATAFPDKFVVNTRPRSGGSGASTTFVPRGFYDPFYSDAFFYPSYYYSPFAYGYIGHYDPGYIHPPGGSGSGTGDGGQTPPSGNGKVINGQGYTRIRPAEAASPRPTGGSAERPVIRSESSSSSSSSDMSSSSGSPSGSSSSGATSGGGASTASPQGYSGGDGGGGGGSGRTAQPR